MINIQRKTHVRNSVLVILMLCTFIIAGLITFNLNKTSSAADARNFNPGRIIDDAVFYNSSAMNAVHIQQFLNAKVPTCDTNGQQLSEFGGPDINGDGKIQRWEWGQATYNQNVFTCLKDYSQNTPAMAAASGLCESIGAGTRSAAQIIEVISQACHINPQVLLVLLNKEQSLVTDTWPLKQQYDGATGFDCPDTAPCDPNYAGFFYQVYYAARQFQIYRAYPNDFNYIAGRNNNIYWNPDLSRCGSAQVYIQNQATAALYIYTPYQPNQAALNNLYGTGDSCSSYGNRNFWRMFSDWFGATVYQAGNIPSSATRYSKAPCTVPEYTSSSVGRLYHPDTQDYLYTTKKDEACQAIKLGYIWDGITLQNPGNQADTIPLYRLRNGSMHIYTTNTTSRSTMIQNGHIDEGVAMYGYSSSAANRLPVYMLGEYDARFLTSAGDEGTYFTSSMGYKSLGVGFYTTSTASTSPLYRLRNGADKLYTSSSAESSHAISGYGYAPESDTLSIETAPGQYSRPVYRLNSQYGRLYTTSRTERDLAVINYDYYSEGIGFYSFPSTLPGAKPVYRSTNYGLKSRLYTQHLGESNNSRTYYGYKTEDISWYGL